MLICQYFKCHPIAALGQEGGYCNYKVKAESEYISQSSGWRWSIDQSKCLQAVNHLCCGASENIFVFKSLEWFGRVALSCWCPGGTSSFGDWLIRMPEREKAKITHSMTWVSEFLACRGAAWEKILIDSWGSELEHVRDYRFCAFQGPEWGVFRGPQLLAVPPPAFIIDVRKRKNSLTSQTVITYPVSWKITETKQKCYPSPELRYSIVQDK